MGTLLRRVSAICVIVFALGWVVFELGGRNLSAAPVAQDATPVAPQPASASPVDEVGNERGVVDARVGSIRIPNFGLSVYARRPTGSVQARNPFFYEVWPVVEYPSSTIYDANSNRLVFDLNIGKEIDPALLEDARSQVATAIGDGGPEDVVLLPLDLEAYELFLTQGSVKELVASGQPSEGPFGPMIAVNAQIDDPTLREALAKDPSSLSLTLRPFYRFKVFDIKVASSEISQKVASATLENVLGVTPPGKVLVTRDVLNKITQESVTSVRRQMPADISASLLESLEKLEQTFLTLPPLSVADLASAQETLYYQVGTAQLEMQPDVLRELTTRWASSEQFKESHNQTWSIIHELATESNSAEEFYNQLHEQYKGGGGGGFEFLGIGANANFNLDLTWDEQSSEKRSDFEKFYEKAQNEGTISEEILNDIAEDWTGERDYTKVTAKDLNIYRVSNVYLQSQISLVTAQLTELPNVLDSRTRTLKLISPSTVVNDAVFVDSEGNVGIGTANPEALLHLDQVANDQWGMIITSPAGSAKGLKIATTYPGHADIPLFQANAGCCGDEVQRFVIEANGNVGIGSITPTYKLHVVAEDAVGLFESTGSEAYLKLQTNEGPDNRVEITNRPGGRFSVWTAVGGDSFNVTRDGNVGIGIQNPEFKLDVNGRVRIQGEGGGSSAGIWLHDSNSSQSGFVGMNTEDTIGFYGSSVGWGLLMNTANGNVTIPNNLSAGNLGLAGNASVNGGLTVNGEIRGKLQYTDEYRVGSGDPLQMIHSSQGFCFLTYVNGEFEFPSRTANVFIGGDGYWYVDAGPNGIVAGARCAGVRG